MTDFTPHSLPRALEGAVQRIKLAVRDAATRTVESLGLAALSATSAAQRDLLLEAQFELNRKSAAFVLAFNEDFDARVGRECGAGTPGAGTPEWASLSLVDDREVEIQVAADRIGRDLAAGCEWELRDLDGYVAAALGPSRGAEGERRNPLRPELIAHAALRGIDHVSARDDVRRQLATEFGRTLGNTLRSTYQDAIGALRAAGLQPAGLAVRQAPTRSGEASRSGAGFAPSSQQAAEAGLASRSSAFDSRHGGGSRWGDTAVPRGRAGGSGGPPPASMGHVDPRMMSLMRRIAHTEAIGPSWESAWDRAEAAVLPNLIRAHRDELREAASAPLDHMVIDVVGSLFDQILADPKVPPQMARQIARLQLPVLRAALGDPSFFSSRRHPVRRFVNRIASLGAAFDDFAEDPGRAVLAKVRELVQEVVEGDFDQIGVYEQRLATLERFVAEQGRAEADEGARAATLLSEKEDELQLRALYAQQLQGELGTLDAPQFLRDFVGQVWSQVLVVAARRDGPDGERTRRLRTAGRELFMSVQPKTSPAHRKTFLAELPRLMQALKEGLDLIGWPDEQRHAFFGQLLPAHAESLKAQPLRPLDFNLMARRIEAVLEKPQPAVEQARAVAGALPVLTEAIAEPALSADEAQRVGLVDEGQVDWSGTVDIVVGDEAPLQADEVAIPGLVPPSAGVDLVEPTAGPALADQVQVGFAYQMHLEGQWQKVRLTHVSAARSFFVFTHGGRHKRTVSLTQRMLVRLCEAGRLRAFESAYLLERATARARRQLAGLRPA
jgi:hypothetical protein